VSQPTIGYIGLAIKVNPMASHIIHAGYKMVVFDIVPSRQQALIELGAEVGDAGRDVPERAWG
jgi:2-hydroxy-3-oxopropionate reductase